METNKARIVFMGTPDFAVPALSLLIQHHDVIGVVTQPDRPAGRNQQIQQSPIKQVALTHGIPVFQPEKIRKPDAVEQLRQWDADVYIVAAFGQILPQAVLDIPPHGSVNIHASLLPRWRGAAPIQAAIRYGDAETGITIMRMDAGLDTGPMLSQRVVPIAHDETGASLHDILSQVGGDLLIETLPRYLDGTIKPQPQDDSYATLAGRISKEEGQIDWTKSAVEIDRLVRAFTPWPGTFNFWNGKLIKIVSGTANRTETNTPPGTVMIARENISVATGDGLYWLNTVQLEGKKATPIDDFVRGYPDFIGTVLN
jgi:methionyl-tRNA formyltransferase